MKYAAPLLCFAAVTFFLTSASIVPSTSAVTSGAELDCSTPGKLSNPLCNSGITNITQLLVRAIQWLLGISAFLAMIAFIYGGIRLITAAGNEQYVTLGKNIIFWAIIGFIVVILSFVILITATSFLGIDSPAPRGDPGDLDGSFDAPSIPGGFDPGSTVYQNSEILPG